MGRSRMFFLLFVALLWGCSFQEEPGDAQSIQVTVQSGLVSFVEGTVDPEAVTGTWIDPESGDTLVFDPQGLLTIERKVNGEYTVEQVRWTVGENGLMVTDASGTRLDYKVVEKDGQIQIMGSGSLFNSLTEQESLLSQEVNYLGMGETAATDLVKLTLNSIEFSSAVSLETSDYLLPNPGGELAAQTGDLLACMSFRVQNLMDEGLSDGDFCNLVLEYDHTYRYSGGRYGTSAGAAGAVAAGSRADYRVVIECPEMVAQENEISLCISLTLPSSEGEVHFTYVLK